MSTYRDDPRWQSAQADLLTPTGPDESPYASMVRHIEAARVLHAVEVEHGCAA